MHQHQHQHQPGYAMHASHARLLAESPWGWRPATVGSVSEQTVTVVYLGGEGSATVWHARSLAGDLEIGIHVRVHEEHHALEIEDSWLNVAIRDGVGPVPTPEHPELWRGEVYGVIVDAATGNGIRISPELARRLRPRE